MNNNNVNAAAATAAAGMDILSKLQAGRDMIGSMLSVIESQMTDEEHDIIEGPVQSAKAEGLDKAELPEELKPIVSDGMIKAASIIKVDLKSSIEKLIACDVDQETGVETDALLNEMEKNIRLNTPSPAPETSTLTPASSVEAFAHAVGVRRAYDAVYSGYIQSFAKMLGLEESQLHQLVLALGDTDDDDEVIEDVDPMSDAPDDWLKSIHNKRIKALIDGGYGADVGGGDLEFHVEDYGEGHVILTCKSGVSWKNIPDEAITLLDKLDTNLATDFSGMCGKGKQYAFCENTELRLQSTDDDGKLLTILVHRPHDGSDVDQIDLTDIRQ